MFAHTGDHFIQKSTLLHRRSIKETVSAGNSIRTNQFYPTKLRKTFTQTVSGRTWTYNLNPLYYYFLRYFILSQPIWQFKGKQLRNYFHKNDE